MGLGGNVYNNSAQACNPYELDDSPGVFFCMYCPYCSKLLSNGSCYVHGCFFPVGLSGGVAAWLMLSSSVRASTNGRDDASSLRALAVLAKKGKNKSVDVCAGEVTDGVLSGGDVEAVQAVTSDHGLSMAADKSSWTKEVVSIVMQMLPDVVRPAVLALMETGFYSLANQLIPKLFAEHNVISRGGSVESVVDSGTCALELRVLTLENQMAALQVLLMDIGEEKDEDNVAMGKSVEVKVAEAKLQRDLLQSLAADDSDDGYAQVARMLLEEDTTEASCSNKALKRKERQKAKKMKAANPTV